MNWIDNLMNWIDRLEIRFGSRRWFALILFGITIEGLYLSIVHGNDYNSTGQALMTAAPIIATILWTSVKL